MTVYIYIYKSACSMKFGFCTVFVTVQLVVHVVYPTSLSVVDHNCVVLIVW